MNEIKTRMLKKLKEVGGVSPLRQTNKRDDEEETNLEESQHIDVRDFGSEDIHMQAEVFSFASNRNLNFAVNYFSESVKCLETPPALTDRTNRIGGPRQHVHRETEEMSKEKRASSASPGPSLKRQGL